MLLTCQTVIKAKDGKYPKSVIGICLEGLTSQSLADNEDNNPTTSLQLTGGNCSWAGP